MGVSRLWNGLDEQPYLIPGDERRQGRLQLRLSEWDSVPPEFVELVDEISMPSYLHGVTLREYGWYQDESAGGELVPETLNGKRVMFIRITSKNLADARTLLSRIKDGSIRPTRSYEQPQLGMSRSEFEATLVKSEAASRQTMQQQLEKQGAVDRVEALAQMLENDLWRWCRKTTVTRQIREMLTKQE